MVNALAFFGTTDRYLTGHLNRSVLAIVLTLASLISLFGLYEELAESQATYGLWQSASFIFTTLPRRLDEVLIYSVFLGFLVALGRLAETNELTAIRTSGHSPARLMLSCAPTLIFWIILNIVITELVAPNTDRQAEMNKVEAQYGASTQGIAVGLWLRSNNQYMRVRAIDQHGDIWGITQYKVTPERELTEIVEAERGKYDVLSRNWVFENATITRISSTKSTTEQVDRWRWNNPITPDLLESKAFLDPNKMSLTTLYQQINLEGQQQVSEHEIAFWSRLLRPLSYLSLCVLALAAIIGPLRAANASLRVTVGIFVGLGFKYLQDLLAPAAIVFQIPAWLGVLIPIVLCLACGIYLLRKHA